MRSHSRSDSRAESREGHSPWPDQIRPPQTHHSLTRVVIA
jgi:hypothetical protein